MRIKKKDIIYFFVSTAITIFTISVACVLFDLYRPLSEFFEGVPFAQLDLSGAIHLEPKIPYIVGIGVVLNFRKLRPRTLQEITELYRH